MGQPKPKIFTEAIVSERYVGFVLGDEADSQRQKVEEALSITGLRGPWENGIFRIDLESGANWSALLRDTILHSLGGFMTDECRAEFLADIKEFAGESHQVEEGVEVIVPSSKMRRGGTSRFDTSRVIEVEFITGNGRAGSEKEK